MSPASHTSTRTFANRTLTGGGSASTTANPTTYTYGTANGTLTANYGVQPAITCPTPTRAGYTFNGWFTAASGGTKRCGGSSGPASYTPTMSETLHAQRDVIQGCSAANLPRLRTSVYCSLYWDPKTPSTVPNLSN